ncbi:dTDP-4-dehydrorhamnose reductase [Defluviimonas sp. WL0002]|uniref:dTDP-4-dehydrorhamnose reductase n=1 Tax=Albidovulum marisflavi TaxID=2984159 RepID=A0ABT2ZA33_9RHOB|nr:dTDP-4-dehydrorhamnose reductase [Defluviimonas sp. WL0002]MCV2867971.1 dTDP-4-dehydrorhamnose reductase [Defluviimonas sp. WL0002]
MRLLVFGETGQVARELARKAAGRGHRLESLGRGAADLTDPAACAAAVTASAADAVINAAAYTAVDQAEAEPSIAHTVNAEAPGAMARAAAARGVPFLHMSTDYVFDGSADRGWKESDATGPLGVYGQTKLAGEHQIAAADGRHVILRTSWVFSAHGRNFVKTMLRLGLEREEISVVDDQRGGPTPADDIAQTLLLLAEGLSAGRPGGTFHYAGAPTVSWADFAEAIFDAAFPTRKPRIRRIPSSAYPTPARRPANSALDCTRIRETHGIGQPDWRAGLARVLKELESAQ